jgi:hypothetical protein
MEDDDDDVKLKDDVLAMIAELRRDSNEGKHISEDWQLSQFWVIPPSTT